MITYRVYEWDVKQDKEYIVAMGLTMEQAIQCAKLKPPGFIRRLEIERIFD